MPKELEVCVTKVMATGKSEKDAFAICQKAINQSISKEKIKEVKRDEDGDIIIAENIPITIGGSFTIVKE